MFGKILRLGKKEKVLKKNKNKSLHVVAIDYGIKKYFKIFF